MSPGNTRRSGATREDVALRAGVSSAVVSYVVNSGPRNVAPATRDRVLRAIDELDYRPNANARALKRGVSDLVGLVLSDITNPYFSEFARAIEIAAGREGLSVIFVNSAVSHDHRTDFEHEASLVDTLLSRQVAGLLWASNDDHPDVSAALAAGTPLVLLDRARPMDGVATLGADFRTASRHAVEHLVSHGHEHIGLIAGDGDGASTTDREAGFNDALADAGLQAGPVVHTGYSREDGYIAGRQLLELVVPPTAVYVISDLQAVGLLRAINEAGLRVPNDIAIISFDGSLESEFAWPGLTAMRQPVQEMAVEAVDMLLGHGDSAVRHRSFSVELVIRGSCGCRPAA